MADDLITDTGITIVPDVTRVVSRLFVAGREDVGPGDSRAVPVIDRILELDESEVTDALEDLELRFGDRHRHLDQTFSDHADLIVPRLAPDVKISDARRLLIGAYFTHEYSIEGAALCNPSIVLNPTLDTSTGIGFVMSVRGIGEGHRSTIGFRTGNVDSSGEVKLGSPGRFPATASAVPSDHHRSVFRTKLAELADDHENAAFVLEALPDRFDGAALDERLAGLQAEVSTRRNTAATVGHLQQLAASSYQVEFEPITELSERVLWPQTAAERHGMEDARFVRFTADDESVTYYATYTAFDGTNIAQHVLQTDDFITFAASPMAGSAAVGKGLALFPRTIDGQYVALSRSDRESNSIAFSDDIRCWTGSEQIEIPARPWELLQLGNCGSPIETDVGWLVLTHGVGAMRTYSLGAILLDLDDPRQVIACSDGPILTPSAGRRDGYVPNVVYSCGACAYGDTLILPYGIGDQSISIATLSIKALLQSLNPTQLHGRSAPQAGSSLSQHA